MNEVICVNCFIMYTVVDSISCLIWFVDLSDSITRSLLVSIPRPLAWYMQGREEGSSV